MSIRIGSYNVHDFCNTNWKDTTKEIADVLENFDIVGLQEVDGKLSMEKLEKYSENFHTIYSDFFSNNAWVLNLKQNYEVLWCKTYKYKLPHYPRGVMSLKLSIDNKEIHLYVTHFDHMDENIRLCQLEKLMEIIKEESELLYKGESFTHFILGDFNALTKSDYTPKELERIADVRTKTKWEPPKFELMDTFNKLGYHDIVGDYLKVKGIHVPLTSRFNTRVDYILASKNIKVSNVGYIQSSASDHLPIFVDIML